MQSCAFERLSFDCDTLYSAFFYKLHKPSYSISQFKISLQANKTIVQNRGRLLITYMMGLKKGNSIMNISPSLQTLLNNNVELILMLIQHDGNRLAELADKAPNPRLRIALKEYANSRLDLAYHIEKALKK
jgi:hypothetical protein